ncbi:squalene synthase HpnC [Rhodospirillales bacterium]|nr:squalene synthase HpnC [Rhodospirillales bacterium]
MSVNTYLPDIEIPSGKDKAYENFPVGSLFVPSRLRPHVNTFYNFARAIDDIADSNSIEALEKIERLTGFENAILGKDKTSSGYSKAHSMRLSLQETGVTNRHCIELIKAFKQDATKLRYENWDELIDYCQMSAAPVGRYLLDLHGESNKKYQASDALCNALQVLNHLQDCKDDYVTLNRVYLPLDWMKHNGLEVECLDAPKSRPELKSLIHRVLDSTAELINLAQYLPIDLTNKRLAMEAGAILGVASRLEQKLRRKDPLAESVNLSRTQYVLGCLFGATKALITG